MKKGTFFLNYIIFITCTIIITQSLFASDKEDPESDTSKEIVLIHTGDFHGNLVPHHNNRADSNGLKEGGLARAYTIVKQIRKKYPHTLHLHTGDTIAGSAVATFTRGQALIDVVDKFGIDAYTPGNWEFGYGIARYLELFGGPKPRWNTLVSNAYYNGLPMSKPSLYPTPANVPRKPAGTLLGIPYKVLTVNGIKLGIFACTTNRGPQVVSSFITAGISFSNCKGSINPKNNKPIAGSFTVENEIEKYVNILRNKEKVDIVILLSEGGLAENIHNAENFSGIDIILSSDMHEKTPVPVVVTTPNNGKTIIVEQGEDATQIGELKLKVKNSKLVSWKWKAHRVDERVKEDKHMAKLIKKIVEPFVSGSKFKKGKYINPYNGVGLMRPLDTVVGYTDVWLTRNSFSTADMPAVVEGTGHDLFTDAFRAMTKADVGSMRGFRFSNSIAPGPITLDDLYHYIPIGPQIAVANVSVQSIKKQIEASTDSCMNPDVTKWAGGWTFAYSNLTWDLNPYSAKNSTGLNTGRSSNIKINARPLTSLKQKFTYASYFYKDDPNRVNRLVIKDVSSIKVITKNGLKPPSAVTPENTKGAVDVIVDYLATLPGKRVTKSNLIYPRVNILESLPDAIPEFGFPVIEPLRGMVR